MNKSVIRRQAKLFRRDNNIKDISFKSLKTAINDLGYTVVEYNHIVNDKDVFTLIKSLGLSNVVKQSKGFTYADSNYRIVFVHEDLSDKEKCIILAHEAGHIYLNHTAHSAIIGKDVQEEYEANEFAHFLLNPSGSEKISLAVKNHKKAIIICGIVLLIIAGVIVTLSVINTQEQYYGEYYVTSTGSKYHNKNCVFVKNKNNIHRLTEDELNDGDYEPCEVCLPEKQS